MTRSARVLVAVASSAVFLWLPAAASAHEDQVIRLGSFGGGFVHPVIGLDHLLAMVSIGALSALIGGKVIWQGPAMFVAAVAAGGLLGVAGVDPGSTIIEVGIAASVLLLGVIIALDQQARVRVSLAAAVFSGLVHGIALGTEVPDGAEQALYVAGFLTGTAVINLVGVLIGDVARRYRFGRVAMRVPGFGILVMGGVFLGGAL